MTELVQLVLGTIEGAASGAVFILALVSGFCVAVGMIKLRKTAGNTMVVKSLDETINHQPMVYYPPDVPRGPIDQLRTPELLEASARSSQ
jgi:hypothetical protein